MTFQSQKAKDSRSNYIPICDPNPSFNLIGSTICDSTTPTSNISSKKLSNQYTRSFKHPIHQRNHTIQYHHSNHQFVYEQPPNIEIIPLSQQKSLSNINHSSKPIHQKSSQLLNSQQLDQLSPNYVLLSNRLQERKNSSDISGRLFHKIAGLPNYECLTNRDMSSEYLPQISKNYPNIPNLPQIKSYKAETTRKESTKRINLTPVISTLVGRSQLQKKRSGRKASAICHDEAVSNCKNSGSLLPNPNVFGNSYIHQALSENPIPQNQLYEFRNRKSPFGHKGGSSEHKHHLTLVNSNNDKEIKIRQRIAKPSINHNSQISLKTERKAKKGDVDLSKYKYPIPLNRIKHLKKLQAHANSRKTTPESLQNIIKLNPTEQTEKDLENKIHIQSEDQKWTQFLESYLDFHNRKNNLRFLDFKYDHHKNEREQLEYSPEYKSNELPLHQNRECKNFEINTSELDEYSSLFDASLNLKIRFNLLKQHFVSPEVTPQHSRLNKRTESMPSTPKKNEEKKRRTTSKKKNNLTSRNKKNQSIKKSEI